MRKKISLKQSYVDSWRYLKESDTYFLIILLLFLVSAFIGFFFPVFFIEMIETFIRDLLEKTAGMNFIELFIYIFQNNLVTAFTGFLFGLVFGLVPLLLACFNGYVLGFVSGKTVGVAGLASLWRLVPHGIFELPALVISFGLGVRLGMFIFAKSGERKKRFLYNLENSLRVFVFIILPLLLIAAIIETWLILS